MSKKHSKHSFVSPITAISSFFSVLLIITLSLIIIPNNSPITHATAFGEIACSNKNSLGGHMGTNNWESFLKYYPNPDGTNRVWTIEEAYSSGLGFVSYNGEGAGTGSFVIDVGKDRGKDKAPKWDKVLPQLEEVRSFQNCIFISTSDTIGNGLLQLSNAITSITQRMVVTAFDSSIFCSSNTQKNDCINILKIIGGDGTKNDTGIIGALTAGIYLPLATIIAAMVGFWALFTAMKGGRVREAFTGIIWAVAAFMIGYAFLLNPTILAKAPMIISNSAAGCIVDSFNGNNCFDNTNSSRGLDLDTPTSEQVCKSATNSTSFDERMSMIVNGMSCRIWKTFVLEPAAQGSFGRSFKDLDVTNKRISATIEKAGYKNSDFCVPLGSSSPLSNQGEKLTLNQARNQVCNLAAYQMMLKTYNEKTPDAGYDPRWYQLITTIAHDPAMWETWKLGDSSPTRISYGFISVILSTLGGLVLFVTALFAFMYYFASVIIIAPAPLFFLAAIHPGRGKRIFFGYFETIISYILKYIASAIVLIIALAFYAGLLSSVENIGLTLMLILVMSLALLVYRKELVEMLGRVNMGGERMSHNFMDTIRKAGKGTRQAGISAVGGAVGGALAAKGGSTKQLLDGARAGLKDNVRNDLKRRRTLAGGVARQYDRAVQDRRKDALTSARQADVKAKHIEEANEPTTREFNTKKKEFREKVDKEKLAEASGTANKNLAEAANKVNIVMNIDNEITQKYDQQHPGFKNIRILRNRVENLDDMQEAARLAGDKEKYDSLTPRIKSAISEYKEGISAFEGDYYRVLDSYKNERDAALANNNIDNYREAKLKYLLAGEEVVKVDSKIDLYKEGYAELRDKYLEIKSASIRETAKASALRDAEKVLGPGENLTNAKIEEAKRHAEELATQRINELKQQLSEELIDGRTLIKEIKFDNEREAEQALQKARDSIKAQKAKMDAEYDDAWNDPEVQAMMEANLERDEKENNKPDRKPMNKPHNPGIDPITLMNKFKNKGKPGDSDE